MDDVLTEIQRIQFTDLKQAEHLLLGFLADTLSLDVTSVELRPLAVSLNSFNGFLTLADGERLFFKTHTEPDSVIDEYYNASSLAESGYDVLQPLFGSTDFGRQLLVYKVVDDPSVFDVAWQIENGDQSQFGALTDAQHQSDIDLMERYRHTLRYRDPAAATAAVHQLFYHRLAGPRFRQFYPKQGKVDLPGQTVGIPDLFTMKWRINGQDYADNLSDLVSRSVQLLKPMADGPSVIGHGDAHNGNVFLRHDPSRLMYFDPAFAGRHDPMHDLAKPLFHNVFAMWMYYPDELRQRLNVSCRLEAGVIEVNHDHAVLPVRRMFLDSKVRHVLTPLVIELARRRWLSETWRDQLKAALFCCPLLTMNLTDAARFAPEIALLGFSYAVEMGGNSEGVRSEIDQVLDSVAASVR